MTSQPFVSEVEVIVLSWAEAWRLLETAGDQVGLEHCVMVDRNSEVKENDPRWLMVRVTSLVAGNTLRMARLRAVGQISGGG